MRQLAKVQICAQTWRVYLVSDSRLARALDTDARGGCFPPKQEIWLGPHENLDAALDTWVHEVAHACISAWGLDLTDKREETLVRRFTPLAIQALGGTGLLQVPSWLRRVVRRGRS